MPYEQYVDVEIEVEQVVEKPVYTEKIVEVLKKVVVEDDSVNIRLRDEYRECRMRIEKLDDERDHLIHKIQDYQAKIQDWETRKAYQARFETEFRELELKKKELEYRLQESRSIVTMDNHTEHVQDTVTENVEVVREGNVGELEAQIKMLVAENERLETVLKDKESKTNQSVVSPDRTYQVVGERTKYDSGMHSHVVNHGDHSHVVTHTGHSHRGHSHGGHSHIVGQSHVVSQSNAPTTTSYVNNTHSHVVSHGGHSHVATHSHPHGSMAGHSQVVTTGSRIVGHPQSRVVNSQVRQA